MVHRGYWPIRIKIFAVSLLPAMALVVMAVNNYGHLNSLGHSAGRIMSRNYNSIRAAQQARQVLEQNRNQVLAFMFRTDPNLLDELEIKSLAADLEACRQHISESGEGLIVDTLFKKYRRYKTMLKDFIHTGTPAKAEEFIGLTASMVANIHALVELNERGMEHSEQETRALAQRAQRHSVILLCITIGLMIALGYGLSYLVARPIRELTQHLVDSRQGGDRYPCLPVRSNDETGLLTAEFNRLFKSLADYDQHNAAILSAEKRKVHQAEEAKTRFIADLSHQLKTPLTSLAMSVGLLYDKREHLPAERVAILLDTAKDDCSRLATLINELVDIARLEAMVKPATREKLDIGELIHECLKPLEKQAEARGVRIKMDIESDLPLITLDSLRFPWVLTNLVGNALRYTDRGGMVAIKVERRQQRFYFQCSDDGCGIDPEYLPRIFDRYTQFSQREKIGTIGLGLAIVKEIIEQHGGDIAATSRPGKGTIFTFWVPEHPEQSHA